MYILAFSLVFIQQYFGPQVVLSTATACEISIDAGEHTVFVRPSVIGSTQDQGQFEIVSETMNGSNRSLSMQRGSFVIRQSGVLQEVAILRLSRGSSSRVHVEMKIIVDGDIIKCEAIHP